MPSSTIGMAASAVAVTLGIKGHCLGISNACTSGTNAVGEAFRLIKSNHLRVVVAGGSEAPLCRLCIEGYGNAGALSRKIPAPGERPGVPRPFDAARDGFVLGEGASVLLLEDLESALERKAKIYAEIAGYGNTSDAFHMTRPDPDGEAQAMRMAMEEAGIGADGVDYINTHGTATEIGDIAEAGAIRTVFGRRASMIPASAAKSLTGHMLAASGALEAAFTAMTLREGVIPPTINLDERDPACDLNVVTERTDAEIRTALTNSFGFGGANAVLLLRKYG
jgi:3-oxoacyl-[acyl-carrier-protein] synthase II